ncbi:protein phosphatase 2C domain-containing protein [Streptomyces qaidamensis]|uniref:protein phosphatase 2C domain-containing protein n=1 Tax=Streptomyces qaidamensis TaxID=1783515 RepID=UPI00099FDB3E|nr:protein phosphatase 2C domain-containing protein [Streptomyces qaidamensis]
MSQQGGRPTGHEDDWWRELYDDSTDDTGPTPARDSLDDRFASASGAVGDGAEERTRPPDRPAGRPFGAEPTVPAPRTGADDVRDTPRPSGRTPHRAPWEPPPARPPGPTSFPTAANPPGHTGQPPGRALMEGRPGDAVPPTGPRRPPATSPPAADPGGPSGAGAGDGPSSSSGPGSPSDARPGAADSGGPARAGAGGGPSSSSGPGSPSDARPGAADSGGPARAGAGGGPSSSAVPPAPSGARPPAAGPGRPSGGWPGDVPPPSAGPRTPPESPGQPPAPGTRPAPVPPPPAAPPAWPAAAADPPGNLTPAAPATEPGGAASPAAGFGEAPYPAPAPADRPPVPPRPAVPPAPSPPTDQRPPVPPGPGIEPSNPADRTPEPPDPPATDRIERPAPAPRSRGHVGTRPPTYDAEPTALPAADPDDLDDLVADTVLDGARYGSCTLRAVSVRGDSARYRGEPRRDALLTARFGTGEHALLLVAMATGARATPGAHRAAAEACHWIGRAVGRSHARLVEDIRDGRRGDLKSGLHRLTDRSLGKLRASASEQGVDPGEYAASLRCLLLSADPGCRTRVFFGVGPGGLFRLREGEWQDIEPQAAEAKGEPVLGFGSPPPETPEGDRLTMDLGIPTPPSPYEPAPEPPREPFRFRTSVARPGDTLLMCSAGLADPLRGEPELGEYLAERWSRPEPPGLAAFLADSQVRVKGYADDRTAAAVWEA